MHIYGPPPLRQLLRTNLAITQCTLSSAYAVHELIPAGGSASANCSANELGVNEAVGRDLEADERGVWKDLLSGEIGRRFKVKGSDTGWKVDAGPITHRSTLLPPP
jgi:ribonuclease Z